MGMLERIKKRQIDGFKEFVINLETSSGTARSQIFTAGVLEDPIYMDYVMKNIRTYDDFLNLSSDQIETVLESQDKLIGLFAKSLNGLDPARLKEVESSLTTLMSKLRDEISYLTEVSPQERDGARFYMLKVVRKLQMEEKIYGFNWNLPPQDVYYPKTYKDGLFEIVFESGVVAASGLYHKGKRLGTWVHNYEKGALLAKGDYSDGLKVGEWSFYYPNGNLKSQGKYKADLKQGTWKDWDRAGGVVESEYEEGVKK